MIVTHDSFQPAVFRHSIGLTSAVSKLGFNVPDTSCNTVERWPAVDTMSDISCIGVILAQCTSYNSVHCTETVLVSTVCINRHLKSNRHAM